MSDTANPDLNPTPGYKKFMEDDDEEDYLVSQLNVDISNQFVVFSIGEEEYGIPILSVQEIISLPEVTRIPGVPEYIPGIINLRGSIIPLYVLRSKFNLEPLDFSEDTIVIIVQTGGEQSRTVGFIVDAVSDVVSIMEEDLSDVPELNTTVDSMYIDKIGKLGSRMIVVINLPHFFSETESQYLNKTVMGGNG